MLASWVREASDLLDPFVSVVGRHVLATEKIHGDDTPVPVLAPGRDRTKTDRLWVYVRDNRPAARPDQTCRRCGSGCGEAKRRVDHGSEPAGASVSLKQWLVDRSGLVTISPLRAADGVRGGDRAAYLADTLTGIAETNPKNIALE